MDGWMLYDMEGHCSVTVALKVQISNLLKYTQMCQRVQTQHLYMDKHETVDES